MDPKVCEESAKDASDFKCEKILHAVDKPIACPTPEKKTESLPIKSKEAQTQLPEKYTTIADLFYQMTRSLRLLHLRNKSPTFENICKKVEVLAKRKFSYTHLAQMKYILPEGIQIDKAIVHDKESWCMKPDMKITLVFEVVEERPEQSAYMALMRYFNSRLLDFFNMHPEGTDIPEATLPEPFSQRACSLICEDLPATSSAELSSTSNLIELLPKKLQLYPSFSRRFSKKNVANQTEEFQCFSSSKTSLSSHASDCLDNRDSEGTWQKGPTPLSDCVTNLNTERANQKESLSMCSQPNVINTPVQMISPPHSVSCSIYEGPDMKGSAPLSDRVTNLNTERANQKESLSMCSQPNVINTPVHMISPPHSVSRSISESPDMKIVSCSDSLMIETPAQSAPGRLLPGSDVKPQNTTAQKSTSCSKPAKRVLDFTLMEGNDGLDDRVDVLESSKALHEFDCISEPSRGCSGDCISFDSVALPREVQENLSYSFEKTNQNQTGLDAMDKNLSSLVDLVNVIDSIFGSVKRTPITKEELLHKIIMNSLDFVEIREVEEQMEILEKLVPDWICKKLVSSGDTMYCVKNVYDLDSVRSRLLSNVTEEVE